MLNSFLPAGRPTAETAVTARSARDKSCVATMIVIFFSRFRRTRQIMQGLRCLVIKITGRFVGDQDLRCTHHCSRHCRALTLSAGELRRSMTGSIALTQLHPTVLTRISADLFRGSPRTSSGIITFSRARELLKKIVKLENKTTPFVPILRQLHFSQVDRSVHRRLSCFPKSVDPTHPADAGVCSCRHLTHR